MFAVIQALYPSAIERLSGLSVQDEVGYGSSKPRYALDSRGRVWIRKAEEATGPAELLAESLGWLLGKAIGVPLAGAAVCLDREARAWLSLQIEGALHWDRDRADLLVNYEGVGAMVTLDMLLMNADRNDENVLLQPSPDEAHLQAWAIDAGNAGVGYASFFARDVDLEVLPTLTSSYVCGLPIDAIRDGAVTAATEAFNLSRTTLRTFVEESCEIAQDTSQTVLLDALEKRCKQGPTLLPIWLQQLAVRP